MSTIPAKQLVAVNPSVIGAGGSALDVIGLMLTENTRPPIGTVQSFSSATAVSDYFGGSSQEAALADVYFAGFDNSSKKPASMLVAQYPTDAVSAFLRGGDVSAMTLAELQALNQLLAIVIDGVLKSATINLASATSFSNAAALLGAGLAIHGVQTASVTGSISGTTLTVTAVGSGSLSVGDVISGTNVTATSYITALGTGVGGTGTYTVSQSSTAGSTTITGYAAGVTYDSVSGAFVVGSGTTGDSSTMAYGSGAMATSLSLTAITGAVLSQGADAAVPSDFMDALVALNSDWVTFFTAFDPDGGSGNDVKEAFADWKNAQNNRFAYICWDTDVLAESSPPQPTTLGAILDDSGDSGTALVWAPDDETGAELAAFVSGAAASIDFEERNGRITFAYKAQVGIDASVTDETIATNLGGNPQTADRGNGYNFYGAYGAANQSFVWFQRGFVTGDFAWLDAYIDQVWLNNSCQIALLNFLQSARSIPYNAAGNGLIEAALSDPIQAALTFGAMAPGTISAAQIAEVNASAGANIADTLQTQGYYLQVLDASADVRAARGSPPCKLFYLDRGAVQAITLSSIAVQ